MPCHAYTEDGVLLLVRGERIVSEAQIDRLLRPDVLYCDEAPEPLQQDVVERQTALGIPTSQPLRIEDDSDDEAGRPSEGLHSDDAAPAPKAPLVEELTVAREVRQDAAAQVARLVDQARTGGRIDTGVARSTVQKLLLSLLRNEGALASLVWLKNLDRYTLSHSVNVAVLSMIVARHSGDDSDLQQLGLTALLHDIGKVNLPASLVKKQGSLTPDEWDLVRQHPLQGAEIALRSEVPVGSIQGINQHHERLDGSGYPGGLSAGGVQTPGRIVAIADVYDAMTSDRPYRRAIPPPEVIRWLTEKSDDLFDRRLVRHLIRAIGFFPTGCLTRLNTGELALVVRPGRSSLQEPVVALVGEPDRSPLERPIVLDLSDQGSSPDRRRIVAVENSGELGLDCQTLLSAALEVAGDPVPALDTVA
jgi:putative nucleotidyltransferase with HDIG domain